MELGSQTVFNESGADVDFRIEGDTDENLFRLDASTNRIGIGQSSPEGKLHIETGSSGATFSSDNSDLLILEHSDSVGLDLRSPAANSGNITFSDANARGQGRIAYEHNNDAFFFCTGGIANERMRIDSSGQVGIGTTSPATQLEVKDSTDSRITITAGNAISQAGINFADNSGVDGIITFDHNTRKLHLGAGTSSFTDGDIIIDSSGRIHIGNTGLSATAEADDLTVGNLTGGHGLTIFSNSSEGGFISFGDTSTTGTGSRAGVIRYQHSDNSMRFATNGNNERLRIHEDGEISIATTSKNLQGGGASDFFLNIQSNTGSNHNGIIVAGVASGHGAFTTKPSANHTYLAGFFMNSSGSEIGNITCLSSAVGFNSTSDYRLKENVTSISDGITRLKQLLPRRFNWISDETNTLQDGFLAHEVSLIVPEAITGEKDAMATEDDGMHKKGDPIYQSMDYAKITPLLTAALQEAIAKIEILETKVAALEAA